MSTIWLKQIYKLVFKYNAKNGNFNKFYKTKKLIKYDELLL